MILDVLHDYSVRGSFARFWEKWALAGNPRHLPVQAIRLNQIDFNTDPVWTAISNTFLSPSQVYTLNVNSRVSDVESSDAELTLAVQSNSNSAAVWQWTGPGQLSVAFTPNAQGSTDIVLSANDGLVAVNSNSFRVTWTNSPPGKGGDPPPPCEAPCPTPGVVPLVTELGPAHPNPFNPKTAFFVDLATPSHATLSIYDIRGRRLRTFLDGVRGAGRYWVTWDGTDESGVHQASGIYFVVLDTQGRRFSQKIVLLK